MNQLLSTLILNKALEAFTAYDETFMKEIPTAGATLEAVSFGHHKTYFDDEMNAHSPLSLITATYDVICDPKDRESVVEAIAKGCDGLSGVKLFNIEMTSTTKTFWNARKGKATTHESHHQPKLVITWSEDMRLL
jgi:hypothetical protein